MIVQVMMASIVRRLASIVLPMAVGLVACGEPSLEDWPQGRPRIDRLQFLQQSPQDPLALEFGLQVADSDGDLADGELIMFIDCSEAARLANDEIFASQTPPVPQNTKMAEVAVVVRISSEVKTGDEIRVGFRLEDATEQSSNEPWVVLSAFLAEEEGS